MISDDATEHGMVQPCLTVILPTYELHLDFARTLLGSIAQHIVDPELLAIIVVVEHRNRSFVDQVALRFPKLRITSYVTEQIMVDLGISGTSQELLRHAGKFSFQSLKKIGGILSAKTDWVLVMDSESKFFRDFSVAKLLADYSRRKYVFFTRVSDRGEAFKGSLSEIVTDNAVSLVGGMSNEWYMEYYHWFYETSIWRKIIDHLKNTSGFERWMRGGDPFAIFENVLYYQYVRGRAGLDYEFVDSVQAVVEYFPATIASRASQALVTGGLQISGLLEHVISLMSVDELPSLEPLLTAYSMPFIRVEPYTVDPRVQGMICAIPSLCALVSSHRARLTSKRVAVCVAGEFRSLQSNLRSIRSFTTGVAVDLFIHHWNTPLVPAIKDALAPTDSRIEEQIEFDELAAEVAKREPNSKPGRDAGSLAMFHGIAASISLLDGRVDDYDIVARIRPDMVFQDSLRDLLFAVASDEAYDDDTVYVPDRFHSQGINDQFAIGSMSAMRRYGQIDRYATENIGREYFNPEHLMARHLLAQGIRIKTLPMCYVLLRSEPADFHRVAHMLHLQDTTWWSAVLPGPGQPRVATAFFAAKAAAMDFIVDHDQFSSSSLVISAEYLTPEAASLWERPFLKIDIVREYKDPQAVLLVNPMTHSVGTELFIDVQPQGLALVPHRPPGIVFIQQAHGAHDIKLTRFADDFGRAAAELIVSTHRAERVGEAAYVMPAKPDTVHDAPPESGRLAASMNISSVDDCGTSLMQHFLLAEPARQIGLWRSTRAALALRRGRQSRRRGDLLAARNHYARVLALNPRSAREWVQYGHVLKDSGDPEEAIAAYAMALALQPDDPDVQFFHSLAQGLAARH